MAHGGAGVQRVSGGARRLPVAARPGIRDVPPPAGALRARGRRRGAGEPRASGSLRRSQPAASRTGVGRRVSACVARARAPRSARRRAGVGPARHAGPRFHPARVRPGGARFEAGPFRVDTWLLPHHVPDAGMRLTAGGKVLAYTGDTGPSPDLVPLARDADLFLSEATYVDRYRRRTRRTCCPPARPASTPPEPAPDASSSPTSGRARTWPPRGARQAGQAVDKIGCTTPPRVTGHAASTCPPAGCRNRWGVDPRAQ